MIYIATGTSEDRDHIIGYYQGNYDDIVAYIDHHFSSKYYSTDIKVLPTQWIPAGFAKDITKLLKDKDEVELNLLIELKQGAKHEV